MKRRIRQVVVTRGEPDNIGISSIAGNLQPISITDKKGMVVDIGPGKTNVIVPIAPGLIRPIAVADYQNFGDRRRGKHTQTVPL